MNFFDTTEQKTDTSCGDIAALQSPATASREVFGHLLEFDDKKHAYTWSKNFVPGVTTILRVVAKPALIQWSAGMASDYWLKAVNSERRDLAAIHKEAKVAHRKKMEAAGDIGTNVHEYAEAFFKGRPMPALLTDEAKRGVEAFHKWESSHKIEIIASEIMVFSKEHYYAGTADFVAKIDGRFVLGDIKTGSGIYPEMRFQTAAYQQAIQEERAVRFDERLIVRFDKKTGEFEAKSFTNFDLDFSGFLAALNLHKSLQIIEKETTQ